MAEYIIPKRKVPRTIDILEIADCLEIIVNDLDRYGVPDDDIADFLIEYFGALKKRSDELKKEYGEKWFKNTPDFAFEK
ncbi:MAG: hypothetical protein IKV88_01760 [Clostridia bacterium]|nr:hypothetical protein [Clostridia bacterium]